MSILEDFIEQVQRWPVSLVMVVALSFAGIAMKRMAAFPNKYISAVLMIMGMVIYVLVSERGSISPNVPYPNVVLGLYGCVLGMISWGVHGIIWKVMSEKLPGLVNGDTKLIKKSDTASPPDKPDK